MLDIRPDSTNNEFRLHRVERLKSIVASYITSKGSCSILDLGGTSGFWHTWRTHFDFESTHVTCVNLDPDHGAVKDFKGITVRYGDATSLPEFADASFDLVFSNSVIEHVGDWHKMTLFTREAKRLGRSYFIQTPYFWFPIEPHARTPFIHWIPESWAYRIVMMRQCGFWPKAKTVSEAVASVQSARMLDARQFSALFDDAEHVRERFIGITKSLMAVRHVPLPAAKDAR